MRVEGGCHCGRIRYTAEVEPANVRLCHCTDCQRLSGSAYRVSVPARSEDFELQGEPRIYVKTADSGNRVSRGFCPTCGSPVLSRNSAMAGMAFVRASSLDDPDQFTPQMVVYTARAAAWDPPASGLPSFEGMPPPEGMPEELS